MPTAEDVLRVARSQIGTVEDKTGSTPYHRWYGLAPGQPWCMVFQEWCFAQAGASDLIHPRTAYTPTAAQWHKDRGQWSAQPSVGALVFFDWPGDGIDRISHVGIVESFDAGSITSIEGNTNGAGSRTGGQVMRQRRARNSSIVGYGHPAYTPTPSADWFDMATEADLENVVNRVLDQKMAAIRDTVWQAGLPDYYQSESNPPSMPAFAALGWAATHAARARDRATEARDAALADGAAPSTAHIDYDQLAAALLGQLLTSRPPA